MVNAQSKAIKENIIPPVFVRNRSDQVKRRLDSRSLLNRLKNTRCLCQFQLEMSAKDVKLKDYGGKNKNLSGLYHLYTKCTKKIFTTE